MTIPLPASPTANENLSGWGRTNPTTAQVVHPTSLEQLQELVRGAPPRSARAAMVKADAKYRYSLSWVYSLDPKGRGVLTCGDHAPSEAVAKEQQADPLNYDSKALASAPPFLPGELLNKLTVRAFNEA